MIILVGQCHLAHNASRSKCWVASLSTLHVCAFVGSEKYIAVRCTEGCNIYYHHPACWRALERIHKLEHPSFSWKVCLHILIMASTSSCPTKKWLDVHIWLLLPLSFEVSGVLYMFANQSDT